MWRTSVGSSEVRVLCGGVRGGGGGGGVPVMAASWATIGSKSNGEAFGESAVSETVSVALATR